MTRSRTDTPVSPRPTVSDATVDVLLCTQALVEERLALSAARAGNALQHAAVPTGLAFVAVFTGLAAGGFAMAATTLALAVWLPWWAATGIVAGLLALLSFAFAAAATWRLRAAPSDVIPMEETPPATRSLGTNSGANPTDDSREAA